MPRAAAFSVITFGEDVICAGYSLNQLNGVWLFIGGLPGLGRRSAALTSDDVPQKFDVGGFKLPVLLCGWDYIELDAVGNLEVSPFFDGALWNEDARIIITSCKIPAFSRNKINYGLHGDTPLCLPRIRTMMAAVMF